MFVARGARVQHASPPRRPNPPVGIDLVTNLGATPAAQPWQCVSEIAQQFCLPSDVRSEKPL